VAELRLARLQALRNLSAARREPDFHVQALLGPIAVLDGDEGGCAEQVVTTMKVISVIAWASARPARTASPNANPPAHAIRRRGDGVQIWRMNIPP
jgi:hypothetical protein